MAPLIFRFSGRGPSFAAPPPRNIEILWSPPFVGLETRPFKQACLKLDLVAIGCRRIVFDAGYVEALNQPNVSLQEGKDIESLDADGIIMKDGKADSNLICHIIMFLLTGKKIPVDVIVCATGFVTVCISFSNLLPRV